MDPIQDYYRGALVGAAVGDALGATVDDLPRHEVRSKFGVHREVVGGGRLNLPAGQVGIDTLLALGVAQSVAETPEELDPRAILKTLLDIFASHPDAKRAAGPITRTVLSRIKARTKDIYAVAQKVAEEMPEYADGGGALLRVAPVGMLRRLFPKEMIIDTINVCRLTHYDQRCVDACLAFNFGVSYLTSGKDPSKLLFKTWRFVTEARESREYRQMVGTRVIEPDMVKALKAVNKIQYDELDASGAAISLTQAAYWIVLNAIDFEEGLVRAVNLGGDAATLGAVAGALLGARFGEQAIPERWLTTIKIRKELDQVADKLWKLSEPKK
ncbi:MAG: ADP-ribosylglycohydrolase family protein [Candidatus Sumerlaeaceae bacterium]|nr:ADP-ribosylglycohydrolase family protein [Candidatus Sumerlaeaceae bacterium]